MKKKLSLLLLTICILFCSLGFVGCADNYDFTITDARYVLTDETYLLDIKCSFTAPEDMILKSVDYFPHSNFKYGSVLGRGVSFSKGTHGMFLGSDGWIPGWIRVDGVDTMTMQKDTVITKGSKIQVAFPISDHPTFQHQFQEDKWNFTICATKPDGTPLINLCLDYDEQLFVYKISNVNMKKILKEDVSLLTQWEEHLKEINNR